MKRSEISKRVLNIVSEQLSIDINKISEESIFDKIGADSLDALEMTMDVEEEFNITISEEELENTNKVSDLVDLVVKYHE